MSEKQEGIVPYTTAGFPNGAGSAKEAVNLEIQKAGENQTNANGILGGRRMTYKKKVRFSRKHRSRARRSTNVSRKRRSTSVSRKRRSTNVSRKRRSTSVSRTRRSTSVSRTRKMYKGGLVDGEAIEVPQFGPSVGPLNPNTASVITNSLFLKAQQDSVYDKDIAK